MQCLKSLKFLMSVLSSTQIVKMLVSGGRELKGANVMNYSID